MPIYEYACGKCGQLFEELVFSAADEAVVACPACGSLEVERRLSACAPVSGGGCAASGPGGFR